MSGAGPLELARDALAGEDAWLVGGAVRDRLLGRATDDIDIALDGDPRPAARRIAKASGGAAFQLSDEFGGWRAVGPGHAWNVDVLPLRDGDLAADLAARDFTINAMAEPLGGGPVLDPHGGQEDLARRVVRMVSAQSLVEDPLRSLRAVRFAVELGLDIDPATGTGTVALENKGVGNAQIFAYSMLGTGPDTPRGERGDQAPNPTMRAVAVNTFGTPAGATCSVNPNFVWEFVFNMYERKASPVFLTRLT